MRNVHSLSALAAQAFCKLVIRTDLGKPLFFILKELPRCRLIMRTSSLPMVIVRAALFLATCRCWGSNINTNPTIPLWPVLNVIPEPPAFWASIADFRTARTLSMMSPQIIVCKMRDWAETALLALSSSRYCLPKLSFEQLLRETWNIFLQLTPDLGQHIVHCCELLQTNLSTLLVHVGGMQVCWQEKSNGLLTQAAIAIGMVRCPKWAKELGTTFTQCGLRLCIFLSGRDLQAYSAHGV